MLEELRNIKFESMSMNDIDEAVLFNLAFKDSMSGLYNRNLWEHMLNGKACFDGFSYRSLLIIDIDDLKEINDNQGHFWGDRMIKVVAQAILDSIDLTDVAFRYGGDEFIVLLQEKSAVDVNMLITEISEKITRNGKAASISFGAAGLNKYRELYMAFQEADGKLYQQKNKKKLQKPPFYNDALLELRSMINITREKLNKLLVQKSDCLNTEVLELSRELDGLIYRYMEMEHHLSCR